MSLYVVMADFYANGAMKGRISPRLPRLPAARLLAASPPCFENYHSWERGVLKCQTHADLGTPLNCGGAIFPRDLLAQYC